jgi:hypothetical protein
MRVRRPDTKGRYLVDAVNAASAKIGTSVLYIV